MESARRASVIGTPTDEQIRGKPRTSSRFTKILWGHLKNEKKRSAQLEKEIEDYKERLDATEEAISEMVGTEEKLQAKVKELEEWAP